MADAGHAEGDGAVSADDGDGLLHLLALFGGELVEAGAASLTLHPRSAKQMYTGEADHSLTAELVELVDVPVIASGDIVSRA